MESAEHDINNNIFLKHFFYFATDSIYCVPKKITTKKLIFFGLWLSNPLSNSRVNIMDYEIKFKQNLGKY